MLQGATLRLGRYVVPDFVSCSFDKHYNEHNNKNNEGILPTGISTTANKTSTHQPPEVLSFASVDSTEVVSWSCIHSTYLVILLSYVTWEAK